MSLHTDASFRVAAKRRAAAARDRQLFEALVKHPKRDLIEVALHLAAASTGFYDAALADGRAAQVVLDELETLRLNGLIG